MEAKRKNNGSVMLITVFIVALLSAVVIGMLQINTEEIQLMQNQIFAAQALATAEAGLNAAFSRIRNDDEWDTGFTDKPFNGGVYNVNVTGTLPNLTVVSEGTSAQGFVARVEADVTVDTSGSSNHTIRIDNSRINE
jgi:Tfp pilus assembly protein PilX